ncbi:DUF4241 domain-containing protein [Archangium gephyra]|uniref:DUF4241 domain-containing protein n=1 Tax=Archangium gephyra TaxID=48 RepID=UPI0011C0FCCF|nr:DUF4241 domain-containing protein [Archangium gephyra]
MGLLEGVFVVAVHLVVLLSALVGGWQLVMLGVAWRQVRGARLAVDDFMRPVPGDSPPPEARPYLGATHEAFAALDWRFEGFFQKLLPGEPPQADFSLWLSPDGMTLGAVVATRAAKDPVERTVLVSQDASGKVLSTNDLPGTGDQFGGVSSMATLLHAAPAELQAFHQQRLQAEAQPPLRTWRPGQVLAALRELSERSVQLWERSGDARWKPEAPGEYGYTRKGAWRYARQAVRSVHDVGATQRERLKLPRLGSPGASATRPGPPPKPLPRSSRAGGLLNLVALGVCLWFVVRYWREPPPEPPRAVPPLGSIALEEDVDAALAAPAFADGQRAELAGLGEVTLYQRPLGELRLTSGRLVAEDAFSLDSRPFALRLPMGAHPVFLTVAEADGKQTPVCARLQVSERPVSRWRAAGAYGVDSGTASFRDAEAEELMAARMGPLGMNHPLLPRVEALLSSAMGGLVELAPAPVANVAVFSSAYGDGTFPTWFGLDEGGQAASVVTCFAGLKLVNPPPAGPAPSEASP